MSAEAVSRIGSRCDGVSIDATRPCVRRETRRRKTRYLLVAGVRRRSFHNSGFAVRCSWQFTRRLPSKRPMRICAFPYLRSCGSTDISMCAYDILTVHMLVLDLLKPVLMDFRTSLEQYLEK
jgi:hypothetical protein